ncbi:hypothetical protein ACLOJK_028645 [Asimina triloba]
MRWIRQPKEGINIMSKARNACPWCCKKTDVIQAGKTIQVRYFLTRMGKMEHSHVIHFQHVNPKSIHLRDVKRWLSDVEGKDMPQSYAWSYKRRYKTGFVWHDVVDDDLIAPIANDAYVLKGSAISPFHPAHCTCKKQAAVGAEEKDDALAGRLTSALEVNLKEDGSDYDGLTGSKMSQQSMSSPPSSSRRSPSHVFHNSIIANSAEDELGTRKGGELGKGQLGWWTSKSRAWGERQVSGKLI